jgi:HAD superfamily hydrolase (TIGR01549 family)
LVAILFDLEGTLVETAEANAIEIRQFRDKVLKKLIALGIPSGSLRGIQSTCLMQNKAFDIVEQTFDSEESENFYVKLDAFLKKYELNWADTSKIFDDTLCTLKKLSQQYVLGIVTNTSKEAANKMLFNHKIGNFFRVVITRNEARKLKPNPEGIRIALDRLNQTSFVFVGNSSYDSTAAKDAGGQFILVKRDPKKALKIPSAYVVSSLTEISRLIDEVNLIKL